MTATAMLDEVAAVTAERDRARDLAAKLEARLELAERVVEAARRWRYELDHGASERMVVTAEIRLCDALAAYDEASR